MGRRITIDKLWFEFGKDELYGESFPGIGEVRSLNAVESILESIGFNKTGFRLEPWCRKCVPGNSYPPLTLALVLCGIDELDTFLPGKKETTDWKYESFSKNFRDDLEINLDDLQYLMRKRKLPLPVALFPSEPGNTAEAIQLSEKEYGEAFDEFAAIDDIEREINSWEILNPISITEKGLKEQKLKELQTELHEIRGEANSEGGVSSEVVLNTACTNAGKQRAQDYCDQYPGVESADITSICDMDGELKSTVLFDEYCRRTDGLNQDGWNQEKAKAMGTAIIRKGEWLCKRNDQFIHIKHLKKKDSDYNTNLDLANKKIKDCNNAIDVINKYLDGNLSAKLAPQTEMLKVKLARTDNNSQMLADDAATTSRQGAFKPLDGAFALEVTITILDDYWLEVKAVSSNRQKVHCATLNLLRKGGTKLNREGDMLYSLLHNKTSTEVKSDSKGVSNLRKILRNLVGISNETFIKVKGGWEPLFTLRDKRGSANARNEKKLARLHLPHNDGVNCSFGSATMDRIKNPEEELEDVLFTRGSADDEKANKWVRDNPQGK